MGEGVKGATEVIPASVVCVVCGGPGLVQGPQCAPTQYICNYDNLDSPAYCYQTGVYSSFSEITIFIHDDVTLHDPEWLQRVLSAFQNSKVAAVGLGGATSLGSKDLYRKPYDIRNMARGGYASHQTDAETHGERFSGVRQVAVLDAFFMAVRTDWLRSRGGWPTEHLTHHCLDLWLACEAARCGKEIWMTGVSCTHHGGGSSTKPSYGQARWLQGGTLESDHQIPHKWLWNEYRDVLPIQVGV